MTCWPAYVAYLVLDSRSHDALPLFSNAMVYVVLPVTVIIVAVTTVHSALETRRAKATANASGTTPPAQGWSKGRLRGRHGRFDPANLERW